MYKISGAAGMSNKRELSKQSFPTKRKAEVFLTGVKKRGIIRNPRIKKV